MVAVDVWSLTLASLRAVGTIAAMAFAGLGMTRLGVISDLVLKQVLNPFGQLKMVFLVAFGTDVVSMGAGNEVRKGLGELSMNLLLPCLMFSQVIYCNSESYKSRQAACPNMAQVILSSADLFLWPVVVVTSGYVLGFLAAKLMQVPENFRRAAAGSVAFGNSTGMPVTLLTTLGPSLVEQGVLQGDPLLYLPVYLVLSPLLQWTVGSYIFQSCEKAVDVEAATPPEPEPEEPNFPRAATLSLPYPAVERPEVRFITLGVPLEVGSGFSAQAEIEDVLKPQDVELKKRDRCGATLRHILFLFLSPPVAATLLAFWWHSSGPCRISSWISTITA